MLGAVDTNITHKGQSQKINVLWETFNKFSFAEFFARFHGILLRKAWVRISLTEKLMDRALNIS